MEDEKLTEEELKIKAIKQKAQVICICKGINLGQMLKAIKPNDTVADVNRKSGAGSGGCKGERCRGKIAVLIKKINDLKS